jgi:pimeloyl-ACP methyl ester carboxylesterase
MTEAMTDWFDAVSLAKPVLIGHSLGGVNAMLLASQRQSILRELMLIDTVGIPLESRKPIDWQRAWVKKRAQSLSMYGLTVPFTIDRSFVKQALVRPKQLASLSKFATQVDCVKVAQSITLPTLIIWGGQDYFTPIVIGETLVSLLRNAKIITVAGNHDWPIFHPEPLLKILEEEGY